MYHPRIEYPDRASDAVRGAAARPALQGSSPVRTPPAEEAPLASQP
jgi:hypothetical protein